MLSKPLTSWLLEHPTDATAVKVIAESDILRSEAAMAMPALRQAALRKASHAEIRDIIGSRIATFPQPERDAGETAAFWADYYGALEGLTAAQVEGGMKAWVADPAAEFLPKPGKLAELGRKSDQPGRWTRAYNRARAAVEMSRASQAVAPTAVEPKPSAEEVQAMLAQTLDALTAKDRLKQAAKEARRKPTPSAPLPAGSHMSAEMRAKLEAEGKIVPDHDRYGKAA